MELRFFYSAHRLIVVFICTKFHENILVHVKVIERTRYFHRKKSKERNCVRKVGGVTVLFFCTCLMMAYICTKFHENFVDGIRIIERTRFS